MAPEVVKVHPLVVRIAHWLNALAVLIMITSGWAIYNASPVFESFVFPDSITLGGWLAGALQWHFAAMWLFALNGLAYLAYGIVSGHFRRKLLPISPRAASPLPPRGRTDACWRRPGAVESPPFGRLRKPRKGADYTGLFRPVTTFSGQSVSARRLVRQ